MDAYFALGIALKEIGWNREAITNYRKLTEIQPDCADAYFALGIALKEIGDHKEAIANYRKVTELKPELAGTYFALAIALREEGNHKEAADAFAEHYRLKPIAQSIFLSSPSRSIPATTPDEVKVSEETEFIPSYISDKIQFGMHMMYVHIPKTGGIRFANPIFGCIREMLLKGGWKKYPELATDAFGKERISLIASHRIDSSPMRDGIVEALASYNLPSLDFSFLTPHGISSSEMSVAMDEKFDIKLTRLAGWKDRRKRLESALNYLYRASKGDLDYVYAKIDQNDPFLDNAIYRGCCNDFSSQISPNSYNDIQVDNMIDIGDFSVMNKVMSSYLSRCRLPNIIVNKKVNITPEDKKIDANVTKSLVETCIKAGFISLDCSPAIGKIVTRELPASFKLDFDRSSAYLHPLTYVMKSVTDVETSTSAYLLPTNYLNTDKGQELLRKTFEY